MTKPKERTLRLDDLIRHFVRASKRVEKDGGYLTMQIQFGARETKPKHKESK